MALWPVCLCIRILNLYFLSEDECSLLPISNIQMFVVARWHHWHACVLRGWPVIVLLFELSRCMYFDGWEDDDDYYHPMRPLPSTWNCGVVVPSDLDVTSLDLKHLQGLSRSLEILTKIRQAKNEYGYRCGKYYSVQFSCFCTVLRTRMALWESQK